MEPFRIMIVEDEIIVAREVKGSLEAEGYQVTAIVNKGETAVARAGEERPDVIIMDIRLKGPMDGIEAASLIRQRFNIPVIFITAHVDDTVIRRACQAMPISYLVKPLKTRELKAALEIARHLRQIEESRRKVEEKLKKSEEMSGTILQSIMDGYLLADLQGRLLEVNEAYCRMSGYSRKELLAMTVADLVGDDISRELVDLRIRDIMSQGMKRFETRHRRKNGEIFDVEASLHYQPLEDGRIFALLRDITESKRTERQIRRNEDRLRSIVAILQDHPDTVAEFLDHALDEAIKLTDSKIGYIYFYDQDRRELTLNSWSKEVMDQCTIVDPQTCYALDQTGIWGEAIRQRQAVIINDFQADHPLKKGYPEGHAHLLKFMTVPVFREGRIVAVVGVANKDEDYDQTDVLQLTLLMDVVWKSVDIRKGEAALWESESVNAALASLSTALLGAESIDVIAELVLFHGKQLTGSRHGFVGHIDKDTGHLVSTTLSHDIWNECRVTDKTYVFEHFKGLWGWVLDNRQPMMTNAPAADPRSTGIPRGHMPVERFISVPVMLDDRLMGQIALANAERGYTEKDVLTLGRLADIYSLALQRLETEHALQRSHDLLEERVALRTAELENVNQSLMAEIKKRKQLEAETIHKSRLASVGELAAGVAHEINNPINVIINYAQILADESPEPEDPQIIPQRIIKEGDRVAAIVRNLLNFARASDDEPDFCDIVEIIDDSLELMRKQLDRDGIRVSIIMPENPPPVIAVFHKMQQVFVNLITNARHALNARYQPLDENKHIEIRARVADTEDGACMRTTLTDNGAGIPAEHLERLFDPFFSTKPKGEGTGLGLSICYGIVRENGGKISIESREGEYTRVIVDLPLAEYDRGIGSTTAGDNNS